MPHALTRYSLRDCCILRYETHESNQAYGRIVNETFTTSKLKTPELLAKYSDTLLKKNPKGPTAALTESELEQWLEKLVGLFKYVDDKDIFQKFYTRAMARRLVYSASVSEDLEQSMMAKLRVFISTCSSPIARCLIHTIMKGHLWGRVYE